MNIVCSCPTSSSPSWTNSIFSTVFTASTNSHTSTMLSMHNNDHSDLGLYHTVSFLSCWPRLTESVILQSGVSPSHRCILNMTHQGAARNTASVHLPQSITRTDRLITKTLRSQPVHFHITQVNSDSMVAKSSTGTCFSWG